VLHAFDRWPTWMWANWEVAALSEWLLNYNRQLPANKRIGFYGLDVYSLWESMESIMRYLETTDPAALKYAEEAYRCFEPYKEEEGSGYARATQFVPELCRDEVVDLLQEIQRKLPSYNTDHENVFSAEQNAYVTVNAEKYYRAMIQGGPGSWNIRDNHMADTLERLLQFHGEGAKAIVWEHNTHIGDSRATDMAADGMFNIGELARQHYAMNDVVLVGFGSYQGTVMAGRRWGAPMEIMDLPAGRKGSWENLLHQAGIPDKLLLMEDFTNNDELMENHIGHRAVGVVYNPAIEQYGNYVPSVIPLRYDAFLFIHDTRALHALHLTPDGHKVPETWPFGV
jgi:erythromycin esterase-like protein